jgi:spore maturation protein CgeB
MSSRRPLRILTATFYRYYGQPGTVEPQYYYLCKVPEAMGHEVDFFDYRAVVAEQGRDAMRRQFLDKLRRGRYDAAFIATYEDDFDRETLEEAKRLTDTFGWNSDDEWRWDSYSSRYVDAYTHMVTNDPGVYEANRARHPNLLRFQWACTGFWDGSERPKDIEFSFAGQVYGKRKQQIAYLALRAGLESWGLGSGRPWPARRAGGPLRRATSAALVYLPSLGRDVIAFDDINAIWNRSAVSFTPLDSSDGSARQIKSRVFDMGLSGSLMLAHRAPHLDEYYEPGREYVPFETLPEAVEKARFYIANEPARRKVARAYAERTRNEHMWSHRIDDVLAQAGRR